MTQESENIEPNDKPRSIVGAGFRSIASAFSQRFFPTSKIAVAVGLILALGTAHLWAPLWWRSFRDAIFPAEGQIIVGSPAVYTRQRLVNDRLSQTSWLHEQLKVTEGYDHEFRGIDEVRVDARSTSSTIRASMGTPSNGSDNAGANGAGSGDKPPSDVARVNLPPIAPTTSDLFRMKNTYREEVRSEIMETQLDDRHDIKGNTIYRLAFDATVLPGSKTNALAVIKVTLSHNPANLEYDYEELYYDWMRRMQGTVASSIEGIATQLAARQPDLRIKLTLMEFVLRRLCEKRMPKDGSIEDRELQKQCDPYSRSESARITEYRKVLAEFSTKYATFRIAAMNQYALDELSSTAEAKDLAPEQLQALIPQLQQACGGSPFGFVAMSIAGRGAKVRCPRTDSPFEGLNGAIILYVRFLQGHSPEKINKAFELGTACTATECLSAELTPADYRCFAAEYMQASLDTFGHATEMNRKPISTFFDTRIIGQDVGNCNLLFTPNWSRNTPKALADELNRGVELYSYSVTPKNLVQHVATTSDTRDAMQALLNANFNVSSQQSSALAENLRKRSSQSQRVQSNPIVVGFGVGRGSYSPTQETPDKARWQMQFGWAIAPQFQSEFDTERKHGERQYSLSALISVPAWWRSVDLKLETCWAERKDLEIRQDSEVCPGHPSGGLKTPQVDVVRLPGAISELSHKLGFEVVQEPRLDRISSPSARLQVETGRPAALLLTGGRIWRSTEVTLGSQKADEIIVLPNMEGILAKFKCVRRQLPIRLPAPEEEGRDSSAPEKDSFIRVPVDIKVWTSEGVTDPAYAELITQKTKFRPNSPKIASRIETDPATLCQDELKDLGIENTAPTPQSSGSLNDGKG